MKYFNLNFPKYFSQLWKCKKKGLWIFLVEIVLNVVFTFVIIYDHVLLIDDWCLTPTFQLYTVAWTNLIIY